MRTGCQVGMWRGGALEDVIAAIGGVGVQGVETFVSQLTPYYGEPGRFRAVLDAAGLQLSGAYFNSTDFITPAAEDAVAGEAAAACDFLRAVGGEFLVVNGGVGKADPAQTFSDDDFARLAAVLSRIGAVAAERGVGAVVHPHQKCMVESPADVDRLVAAGVDRGVMGLCVHASHQLNIGADPYAIYETYGAWVRYVHVGDATAEGKGALLDEGVLDQERLMRPLLDAGFDGWIILECGKEGLAPEDYARRTVAYLKSTWPQVPWAG